MTDLFIKAIVFDLDDTLVDTFKCLIEPLEDLAARKMVRAGLGESDHELVAPKLVQLRMRHPDRMEEAIRQSFPQITEQVIEAWRSVHANLSLSKIRALNVLQPETEKLEAPLTQYKISAEVQEMLKNLAASYDLYLLTTGSPDYQNQKIDYLDVREFFRDDRIIILNSGSEKTKEDRLRELKDEHGYRADTIVVVGNGLDHEIRAGNKLGMYTIWVAWGEGRSMEPADPKDKPKKTIDGLTVLSELSEKLPDLLNQIETSHAGR